MQHIVSMGGGTSSTLELPVEVVRKYGKENTTLVIAAVANENPSVWLMVKAAEKLTGIPVTIISYTPDPPGYLINPDPSKYWSIWDVFFKVKLLGNTRQDPCSRLLKRETLKKYVLDNFIPENTTMHVGVTWEEIDRMMAITSNWKKIGISVEADLADKPRLGSSGERALQLIGWQPESYKMGFKHNNCNDFCPKAGHKHMARLLWYKPDVFYYHAEQERKWQLVNNKSYTMMRDTARVFNPETKEMEHQTYALTMFDFAERMKSKWDGLLPGFDPFEGLDETPPCSYCGASG